MNTRTWDTCIHANARTTCMHVLNQDRHAHSQEPGILARAYAHTHTLSHTHAHTHIYTNTHKPYAAHAEIPCINRSRHTGSFCTRHINFGRLTYVHARARAHTHTHTHTQTDPQTYTNKPHKVPTKIPCISRSMHTGSLYTRHSGLCPLWR